MINVYDEQIGASTEKDILKECKNFSADQKIMIKLELLHLFGYEKKIAEFKEKLISLPMEQISIYDLPFIEVSSYNSLVVLGIKTFKDLCYYDLNDLHENVNKTTFDDIMRFADTADVYVTAGIIKAC